LLYFIPANIMKTTAKVAFAYALLAGGCGATPRSDGPVLPPAGKQATNEADAGAAGPSGQGIVDRGALLGAAPNGDRAAPADAADGGRPPAAVLGGVDAITVTISNPLAASRTRETIALPIAELRRVSPGIELKNTLVAAADGSPVLSQLVDVNGDESPDEVVFQSDFQASETKSFRIQVGTRLPAARSDFKVYGRFVRERHDDFAWENDLVAHRVYGPDLETNKKEPLTSSGVDTWVKRVRTLVVNDWYLTDNYHQDQGEGADFYSVGKSRGCGGLGIWSGQKLHVSRNFRTSRVLANGPIRLVFELDYAPWDAGPSRVAETRRVTLDAGTHFNRIESSFTGTPVRGPLAVAIGIAKHPGIVRQVETEAGRMSTWEPLSEGRSGNLGCAIVLSPGASAQAQEVESDYLLVTPVPPSGRLTYYAGSAWDRSSEVSSAGGWAQAAASLSARLAAPLKVDLAPAGARSSETIGRPNGG
jgi:hypothetical protein